MESQHNLSTLEARVSFHDKIIEQLVDDKRLSMNILSEVKESVKLFEKSLIDLENQRREDQERFNRDYAPRINKMDGERHTFKGAFWMLRFGMPMIASILFAIASFYFTELRANQNNFDENQRRIILDIQKLADGAGIDISGQSTSTKRPNNEAVSK